MAPILALNLNIFYLITRINSHSQKHHEGRIHALCSATQHKKRLWVHLCRRPVFQRSVLGDKKYCLNLVMTSFSMQAVWPSSLNLLAHSTTWHFVYREMTPALFGSFGSSSSSCSGSWGNACSWESDFFVLLFFVASSAPSSPVFLLRLLFLFSFSASKPSSTSTSLFRDPKGRPARFRFPRCRNSSADVSRDFFASERFWPSNAQSGWSGKLPLTKPKSSKIASNSWFWSTLSFRRLTKTILAWPGSVASNGNTNFMHWSVRSLMSDKDFSILESVSLLPSGMPPLLTLLSTSISLLWECSSRICLCCSSFFPAALRNASCGLNPKLNGPGKNNIFYLMGVPS